MKLMTYVASGPGRDAVWVATVGDSRAILLDQRRVLQLGPGDVFFFFSPDINRITDN